LTYLIVGASSGVGRALANRFAVAGYNLVLVSSDERDVAAVSADLSIRYGVRVAAIGADVGVSDSYLDAAVAAADSFGGLDGALFPVGAVSCADDGHLDSREAAWLTRVNFLSVVSAVSRLLPLLRKRPQGMIVGFGSVAAVRGRRSNIVYAAAKRALGSFFESLRHTCAGSSISVQFYVLGFVDTNLAFGRRTLLPRAAAGGLSEKVFRNLHRNVSVVYYPWLWRPVCLVVRWAPLWILNRVDAEAVCR